VGKSQLQLLCRIVINYNWITITIVIDPCLIDRALRSDHTIDQPLDCVPIASAQFMDGAFVGGMCECEPLLADIDFSNCYGHHLLKHWKSVWNLLRCHSTTRLYTEWFCFTLLYMCLLPYTLPPSSTPVLTPVSIMVISKVHLFC